MTKAILIKHLQDALTEKKNRVGKSLIEMFIDTVGKGPAEIADEEATKILRQVLKS
jgi:hypothetical protein